MAFLIILLTTTLILVCFKNSELNKEKTALEKKFKTVSKDFLNYKNNIKYLKEYESIRYREEKLERLIKRMEFVLENTNKEINKRKKEADNLAIEIEVYTKLKAKSKINFPNQKFLQN